MRHLTLISREEELWAEFVSSWGKLSLRSGYWGGVASPLTLSANENLYLKCAAQIMKSGEKENECAVASKIFFQEKQEFHGIIYQGNREYFRPVLISGQPIKMFWWIDHLIVMFLIRFFGHYWHFCCLAGPISDVMIGLEGLGIVFPRPWHWAWLWLWCWHHWHRVMSPRVTQTSRGLGKTDSVTKLSPQSSKPTEMSILSLLSAPAPHCSQLTVTKLCLFWKEKWILHRERHCTLQSPL